jgi:hypothetical protein
MAERPQYSNYERDVPSSLARVAVFVIPLAHEIIDGRKTEEKTVASRKGGGCILPTREDHNG